MLRPRWWEAFIAAGTLGLSWEFAYHARWVANDCLLTQFAALTILMLALFHRTERAGWVYGAAVAVGLEPVRSIPGVILLVPVLIAGVARLSAAPAASPSASAPHLACAAAFAAYLLTTPGSCSSRSRSSTTPADLEYLFGQPLRLFGRGDRRSTGSWCSTTLRSSYFSPWKPAPRTPALGAVGGDSWLRADRRFGALLVGFPFVFL